MSDFSPTTLPRSSLLTWFFNLLLRSDPVPESETHLDAETRYAIQHLSPHMRRDIGLID